MKKKVFNLFVYLWIFLALFELIYNSGIMFKDFNELGKLSDSQKREEIFGDKFKFIKFVQAYRGNEKTLILLTNDPMVFYLSRYYLYPTKLYWAKNLEDLSPLSKEQKIKYVFSDDMLLNPIGFQLVASQSSSTENTNYFYKIK